MIHSNADAEIAVVMIRALGDRLATEELSEEERGACFSAMVRYQLVMAAWFGRCRGWSFLPVLAADRVWDWEPSPAVFNAPFVYYDEQGEVAVACHLARLDEDACRAFAAQHDMAVTFPDETSWWAPGFATIALYQHPRSFH